MASLKQKTISGLLWSFVDQFANLGITFIVGIILARILSPREFGLVGMIVIFIEVSNTFINSGFGNALIRKKNCTQTDYSTVFFFNLASGAVFFIALFFSAPAIGNFFIEPQLIPILRVMGVGLIITSLTLIQRTILTKRIDFKLQARISVIASVGSGIISVTIAYLGFGVWSLVGQRLSRDMLNSIFLWIWNRWKPMLVFSKQSFNELFGFGSKLLVGGLIDTIYNNVYYLIIGKYFSAQDLGYYTRADQFQKLPSQTLNGIIARVSYPVLSNMQHDIPRLKTNYQLLIRSTMFITFVLMLGMAAVAEPMIISLIGEKWRESIIYLQMLSFVGMIYPMHALNLNILMVNGRSDLTLKLEIIKKVLAAPIIIIGIFWGIKIMIAWMMVNTLIAYYLNSYWSGKMIDYSFKHQIKDIMPAFCIALCMAIIVYGLGLAIPLDPLPLLIIQITSGAAFVLIVSEISRFKDYLFLKSLIFEKISTISIQKNGKTK